MINWAQNEAENGRERERERENGGKFASVVALLQAQLNSESRQVNVDRLATCHMQLELPASVLLSLLPPFASILCAPVAVVFLYTA